MGSMMDFVNQGLAFVQECTTVAFHLSIFLQSYLNIRKVKVFKIIFPVSIAVSIAHSFVITRQLAWFECIPTFKHSKKQQDILYVKGDEKNSYHHILIIKLQPAKSFSELQGSIVIFINSNFASATQKDSRHFKASYHPLKGKMVFCNLSISL